MDQENRRDRSAAYHERRLEEFRTATAHREMAVAAAMHYCGEVGIAPPQWLTKEAASLMCDLLKSQRTTKLGRHAGVLSRFRQDQRDLERWSAVRVVRDMRHQAGREEEIMESERSSLSSTYVRYYSKHLERRRKWLAHGTFPCASMYLLGTDAFAGPDAVKASHAKIEETNAAGVDRWCVFEWGFLLQVGIVPAERQPGKKLLHLFDLEP